jgi:hypothetical protein
MAESTPVSPGDRVRIVAGLCVGREGVIRSIMRQTHGDRRVLFWIDLGGEQHVFLREEFKWTGKTEQKGTDDG